VRHVVFDDDEFDHVNEQEHYHAFYVFFFFFTQRWNTTNCTCGYRKRTRRAPTPHITVASLGQSAAAAAHRSGRTALPAQRDQWRVVWESGKLRGESRKNERIANRVFLVFFLPLSSFSPRPRRRRRRGRHHRHRHRRHRHHHHRRRRHRRTHRYKVDAHNNPIGASHIAAQAKAEHDANNNANNDKCVYVLCNFTVSTCTLPSSTSSSTTMTSARSPSLALSFVSLSISAGWVRVLEDDIEADAEAENSVRFARLCFRVSFFFC
jgi:hypothetical protein